MIISEEEYKDFWGWMRKYISNNCIFHSGILKSSWYIDLREDKSWMADKIYPIRPRREKISLAILS